MGAHPSCAPIASLRAVEDFSDVYEDGWLGFDRVLIGCEAHDRRGRQGPSDRTRLRPYAAYGLSRGESNQHLLSCERLAASPTLEEESAGWRMSVRQYSAKQPSGSRAMRMGRPAFCLRVDPESRHGISGGWSAGLPKADEGASSRHRIARRPAVAARCCPVVGAELDIPEEAK